MKKIGIWFLMIVFAATVLTGCGKKKTEETVVSADEVEEAEFADEEEEFEGEYAAYSDGAEWGNNFEGSAVYLEGTTAVVTIAVSTAEEPWKDADLKAAKKKAKTAVDYITKAGKEYKKDVKLLFDQKDLNYEYTFDGEIADFEYEDYDGVLTELLDGTINAKEIRKANKADGIAYLFLLNGRGESFASPHLQEDETSFFDEGAYVYASGYDEYGEEIEVGPDVYVHELLRLFGAVELTEPDPTYGYTTALCNVVRDKYSDDVMFTTLDKNKKASKDKVVNKITDITAYSVGLLDKFAELKDNAAFTKDYPCCFVDNYMKNTKDGEDTSAYDWDDAWDGEFDESFEDEGWSEEEWSEETEEWSEEEVTDEEWTDEADDWSEDEEWEDDDWEDEE